MAKWHVAKLPHFKKIISHQYEKVRNNENSYAFEDEINFISDVSSIHRYIYLQER